MGWVWFFDKAFWGKAKLVGNKWLCSANFAQFVQTSVQYLSLLSLPAWHLFTLSLSLSLSASPLPSTPPLSGFPHSSVLSLHLLPLLCTHVLQLFQLLQDTWPLEGGFLHVHLLSISLSLSLSQSSILSVFQPTPKKVYIYLHLASSSSTNTTTKKFLCQDFSLDSFSLLFVVLSDFRVS